jgi:hypothetical protein
MTLKSENRTAAQSARVGRAPSSIVLKRHGIKRIQIRRRRRLTAIQKMASVLLAVGVAMAMPGIAQACGFHTHIYISQLATNMMHQSAYAQRYPELVHILDTYPGMVEAGEVFPDWGLAGNILMSDCGQTCLDAGEIAHGNIKNSPNFQRAFLENLIPAARQNPQSEDTEKAIAFLLGVIGHDLQDSVFDYGLMAMDFVYDPDDTHEFVDLAVNAFTIVDLDGKSVAAWNYPYEIITDTYNDLNYPVPWAWLRDGTSLGLLSGYVGQDVASRGYYWPARLINHTWLYASYQNFAPGGLNDLGSRTAAAWMSAWNALMGNTFHAKPAASGTGDCLSWANACTLRTALSYFPAEVWVAEGTHKPSSTLDRTATFTVSYGSSIYGGFDGTETARAQRNPATHVTILSGDLLGNDSNSFISIAEPTRSENSYHVVTAAYGDVLDGFTITGGNADGSSGSSAMGGGMLNDRTGPTITNVTFTKNSARVGGGMVNSQSSPTMTNVNFINNAASESGGGMYNYSSNPAMANLLFENNYTAGNGGGMYNYSSSPAITTSTFTGNVAQGGGGMVNDASSPTLAGINFHDNYANLGGGMVNTNGSSPALANTTFEINHAQDGAGMYNIGSNPTLANVIFDGNLAEALGGGMYNSASNPSLTDVTFNLNRAGTNGGGMANASHSHPTLVKASFIENYAQNGGGIYNHTSNTVVTNSTFIYNDASADGGAINNNVDGYFLGTNITVAVNYANRGGGVYSYHSQVDLRNSLLWENVATTYPQILNNRSGLYPYDMGLVNDINGVLQDGCPVDYYFRCTAVKNADSRLGSLGSHGGLTQTLPILPGSSAINGASSAYCPTTDQRGVSRPQGSGCDIGAYEGQPTTLALVSFTRQNPIGSSTREDVLVFRVTFNEAVQNLDETDFLVSGTTATITNISTISDRVFDLTVSEGDLPGMDGMVGLNLAPNQDVVNMAGYALPNGEPPTDEAYSVFNSRFFLVSFTRQNPSGMVTNADELVFRATFSEDVRYVSVGAFIVTGSTATNTQVTTISPSVYDVVISGGDLANLEGMVGINLRSGSDISSVAGGRTLLFAEPNIDETYYVDNTPPSLLSFTRQDPTGNPTNADTLVFRAIFSEEISNVHGTDFTVAGSTASVNDVSPVSGSVYDLTVSGGDLAYYSGVVGLSPAEGRNITDLAGNQLPAGTPTINEDYTLDNEAPTITITEPNTLREQSKTITASVSDGSLSMSDTREETCDDSLSFVTYSAQIFTDEASNGIRVCYRAQDALGNTRYSLSNPISGIDPWLRIYLPLVIR